MLVIFKISEIVLYFLTKNSMFTVYYLYSPVYPVGVPDLRPPTFKIFV